MIISVLVGLRGRYINAVIADNDSSLMWCGRLKYLTCS